MPTALNTYLSVKDSYGWPKEEMWRLFVPFSAWSLCSFVVIPVFQHVLNNAWSCVWMNSGAAIGLVAVNWLDLGHPVPVNVFYAGLVNVAFASVSYVLHPTIISTSLPPDRVITAMASIQAAGQIGRTVAPVMATQWYKFFTDSVGMEGGLNAALLFMIFWAFTGNGVPMIFFRTVYGSFSAPSKAQLAAQKKKSEQEML